MKYNEKEYFKIDTNEKILIYGAAAIGLSVYDICKELSIPVLGFLDKRGDEIQELNGLNVWSIDDAGVDAIDRNTVIFIAVKNVFEHDNIAKILIDKGFSNIIYRPYAVIKGLGNQNEKKINEVYDRFMNSELVEDDIPKTFRACQYEYKDYATIRKTEQGRVVYVPIESLFTDKEKSTSRWNWSNIPIMGLVSHIAFFRWMDQQEGFLPEKYLEWCINSAKIKGQIKITEQWKENVIKNRADVYVNMNESLERDFDFFIRNAPIAEWNDEGHFNLVSGKHRATFWLAKGRRYIPLKVSEDDFKKWINRAKTDSIIKEMNALNIGNIHAPVEHPYFYDIPCENRNFYYKLLCEFIFIIATKQYEKSGYINFSKMEAVFISLNDDGYTERTLLRYGMKVDAYNKSAIATMLDALVVKQDERCRDVSCQYALVEYGYGTDICFKDILKHTIQYMICLVAVRDSEEFEIAIGNDYSVVKLKESYKDNENTRIYWLERKNA